MSEEETRVAREDVMELRDKQGRFLPGNELGRCAKGIKKPRDPKRALKREARKMATEMIEDALPALIDTLIKKAQEGEIGALNTALKVTVPQPKQETYLDPDVMAEAALLDPTSRTEYIHRQCLMGKLSVEVASELGAQCAREAEAQVLRTMKLISRDMKHGLAPQKAFERLSDLAEGINEKYEPVMIEGEKHVE
jgi:hypothetical protein